MKLNKFYHISTNKLYAKQRIFSSQKHIQMYLSFLVLAIKILMIKNRNSQKQTLYQIINKSTWAIIQSTFDVFILFYQCKY